MRNFFIQSWYNFKGLFGWLSPYSYITNIFIGPAIGVITYALLGQFAFNLDTARYYGIGVIMSQMAFIVLAGLVQSYSYDKTGNTISFVYISTANRLTNYLCRGVFHYPNGLLVYATGITTLWLMLDIDFSRMNWPAFILAVLVVTASVTAFGEMLGIFTIVIRQWVQTMITVTGVLFIFTGMIIPLNTFSPFFQGFGHILPITHGLEAVRSAIAGGPAGEIYMNILREAAVGIVCLGLGFLGFVNFERLAKRNGTLERNEL